MFNHSTGYPTIIGSHNTHRVVALKEVGGLAPHDADDLLLTLSYQSHGWHGVYVPKILARGLSPLDWSTYLTQHGAGRAPSLISSFADILNYQNVSPRLRASLASFMASNIYTAV